jgi:hypothetical protein
MESRQEAQPALFYEFSLEDHIPQDHLLRSIDRFVDLSSIRVHLADFYSEVDLVRKGPLNPFQQQQDLFRSDPAVPGSETIAVGKVGVHR